MADAEARRQAKIRTHATINAATLAYVRGSIDEKTWQRRVTRALARAYLLDDDPRWQSGFDGDAALWREAREPVLDAVDRDGTLLDVGCATGHLMECLVPWAVERGRTLSVFGLELDPDLADAARRRLPDLASRIFSGNVTDWTPPQRFTFVRTGLEYVPVGRAPHLVARLLRDLVEPCGRLIVGPVGHRDLERTCQTCIEAGFGRPATAHRTDRNRKTRHVVWVESGAGH